MQVEKNRLHDEHVRLKEVQNQLQDNCIGCRFRRSRIGCRTSRIGCWRSKLGCKRSKIGWRRSKPGGRSG